MVTDANRHELITNSNAHEMQQEKQGVLNVPRKVERQLTETHELDPNSHMLGPDQNLNEYTSTHELEITSNPAASAHPPFMATSGPASRNPIAGRTPDEEEDEEGMRILQDRIERIRAEKERLQKIQELELLEEETKRAILEKARRTGRGASASGNV
jgi:hypothetical protein